MSKIVQVRDKKFKLYIPHEEIIKRIEKIAESINEEYQNDDPLFLGVLNGSFIFAAELYQRINVESNISFVKVSSYSGTKSTEHIKQLIGFDIPVRDRRIIILEDIIDSGLTMRHVLAQLSEMGAKDVRIATLLFKPDAFKEKYHIDYIGISIPNDFILGFGLDYDGYGRNYEDIYKIVEN
ncbi:hypoxanthine phosphoribosyltransferase [Odoribacter sp. OttesenSCG-928-L07]|nr:hypoxanthine phosphoribosyltransferase [Odoribacter sp. OttesenSCG-928-L07]MDL2239699.1 hypoxanthine phosphoribosyltransferase [Bacteroidales bacterium OttesenSCG-928-L14]MDL2240810.1 hypoxanthine phosphoribosyltransferase [Bacteroidales bacterium OttesenSCG-928-K22]